MSSQFNHNLVHTRVTFSGPQQEKFVCFSADLYYQAVGVLKKKKCCSVMDIKDKQR